MQKIHVQGGQKLAGKIPISGAKNSALKLLCATLLTEETVTLRNIPELADIVTLSTLLAALGTRIELDGDASAARTVGRVVRYQTKDIQDPRAPYDLVRKMRASIGVLGPLLGRCHKAVVSLPGGCAIGARPVDLHIMAMQQLGAKVEIENGYIVAEAPGGLKGGSIIFPKVTVMGTENALMAATLAKGETVISNAAREPEVKDLGEMLIDMGAKIKGLGTDTLHIEGVEKLHGADHEVLCDRIETGTYAVASAITGGDLHLIGGQRKLLNAALTKMEEAGVIIEETDEGLRIKGPEQLQPIDVMTEPFPGFATDLQAQVMVMMTQANGASMMTETIFENRFMHVPELNRMGANIVVHGRSAMVRGGQTLHGAPVMATDLRASVSLILAGLVAEGKTTVNRIYHLDRGYERIEEKLSAVGANIKRFHAPEENY